MGVMDEFGFGFDVMLGEVLSFQALSGRAAKLRAVLQMLVSAFLSESCCNFLLVSRYIWL
jgi:hypothetical protein